MLLSAGHMNEAITIWTSGYGEKVRYISAGKSGIWRINFQTNNFHFEITIDNYDLI